MYRRQTDRNYGIHWSGQDMEKGPGGAEQNEGRKRMQNV